MHCLTTNAAKATAKLSVVVCRWHHANQLQTHCKVLVAPFAAVIPLCQAPLGLQVSQRDTPDGQGGGGLARDT